MGTFGGALEARQIDASNGKLTAEITGEVETEENVLVIRRIHVAMKLVAPQDVKDTVERVHGMYAMRCRCIELSTRHCSSRPPMNLSRRARKSRGIHDRESRELSTCDFVRRRLMKHAILGAGE